MPASFVAFSTSGATRLSNDVTYTTTVPVGTVEGDGMFSFCAVDGGGATLISSPSGWNIEKNERWGGTGARRVLAHKVMTAADIAAGTFDWTWSAASTGQWWTMSFTEIDPDNFFTTANFTDAGVESDGSNVSMTCPSVTAPVANSLILRYMSIRGWNVTDTGNITEPASHTEIMEYIIVDDARTYGVELDDTLQVGAGASGTQVLAGTGFNAAGPVPDYHGSATSFAIGSAPIAVASAAGPYRTFEAFRGYRGH